MTSPLPVLALLFNAFVWGVAWWPFRTMHTAGLHPLWATALMYCGVLIALLALRPGIWAQAVNWDQTFEPNSIWRHYTSDTPANAGRRWIDEDFDRLYQQAQRTPDPASRARLYQQAGLILHERAPVLFGWQDADTHAMISAVSPRRLVRSICAPSDNRACAPSVKPIREAMISGVSPVRFSMRTGRPISPTGFIRLRSMSTASAFRGEI